VAKLTTKAVERSKPGRHADGQGLYLLVSGTAAKSWVLRVQVHGRRRDIGLGSIAELTLAEARDKARELRRIAKSGGDPIAARDREKAHVPTFEVAADVCHKEGPPSRWQKRHADAFISSLKQHAFPRMGRLLVDSIDENSIVAVLAPLWHEKPAAARKVRQRITTVLDFAKVSGWRLTGAPNISPRASLGKQPSSGNFAAMPYADVPEFVATLRSKPISAGRLALVFAILTAARSGEVRAARWSHIDLEARTWTRPAELMKSREPHVVTLSPAAVAMLELAKQLRTLSSADLVFPGANSRPLADMTLLKIVKADAGPFTVHGFRAAFRTWAAEQMPTIPDAVAEAALAHAVPDAVVRAYQRAKFIDLRRTLLDAWAAFVDGQSNVVRLASAS
jgi:integrase